MAVFNTFQNLVTLNLTCRPVYHLLPVSLSLQAWTFAVWTLTSAVARGYAAYNIHNKPFVAPPSCFSYAKRS
ncbi:hypothetical protein PAXINDRAFT_117761 [Paxillus involutus ATCC 200175]|uniref:Uncharacterized protein n=1 Tax=Paxillus involutus ATCC 200175 TaxID=664439 RepID=A0A0C9TQP5_PAXIN|nr:hypothetical protein PAXINDRAFT_117761 [Paxillus involutus ATCC 200175]